MELREGKIVVVSKGGLVILAIGPVMMGMTPEMALTLATQMVGKASKAVRGIDDDLDEEMGSSHEGSEPIEPEDSCDD